MQVGVSALHASRKTCQAAPDRRSSGQPASAAMSVCGAGMRAVCIAALQKSHRCPSPCDAHLSSVHRCPA